MSALYFLVHLNIDTHRCFHWANREQCRNVSPFRHGVDLCVEICITEKAGTGEEDSLCIGFKP